MSHKKRFIVIEGPIGVGKTTLATKLSRTFNCKLMLEDFSENPFLKNFYKNPKQYAFSTQLHFLLKRSQQYADYKIGDITKSCVVSDYYLEKDKLFAETTLNKYELNLYKKIYGGLKLKSPKPDLIIYLQAPLSILLERIKSRAIDYEQEISKDYVNNLINAYTNHFHTYKKSSLLIINTTNVDINNSHDYKVLTDEISKDIKGKKYFNPTTSDN